MKNNILLLLFIILITACSQNKPAGVDYLGKNYYGKNSQTNNSTKNKNYIIVSKGDTLTKIARKYNININKLAALNNIDSNYKVKLGQKLLINRNYNDIVEIPKESQRTENKYNPYEDKVKIKQLEPALTKAEPNRVKEQVVILPAKPSKEVVDQPITIVKTKDSKYIWPVKGKIISGFGPAANGTKNDGINIEATFESEVKATADGIIAYSGNGLKGYGNLVIIKHNDNVLSAYAHMNDLLFSKGDKISQGQVIGHVGSSGDVSVPQLHFAFRIDKKPANPLLMLP